MTTREYIWTDLTGPGIEHLKLTGDADGYLADGLYVGRNDDTPPFRVQYMLQLGPDWELRAATVHLLSAPAGATGELSLAVDQSAEWTKADGTRLSDLTGCHEIDIFISAFTNSLAIRRLGLSKAESAEISVAYIDIPQMRVRPVRQRYTCIRPYGPEGGLYRYEPLFRGNAYDLEVDADGLIVEYPGAFRRVWAS